MRYFVLIVACLFVAGCNGKSEVELKEEQIKKTEEQNERMEKALKKGKELAEVIGASEKERARKKSVEEAVATAKKQEEAAKERQNKKVRRMRIDGDEELYQMRIRGDAEISSLGRELFAFDKKFPPYRWVLREVSPWLFVWEAKADPKLEEHQKIRTEMAKKMLFRITALDAAVKKRQDEIEEEIERVKNP